jgi:hypothetical protein
MNSKHAGAPTAALALAIFGAFNGAMAIPTSQPILPGETRNGSIPAPGAADSWTFSGTAGDRIVVAAITTSGSLDTEIDLHAPGGGVEAATHGAFGGGDRLDHQLLASGTYTLQVQDWALANTGAYIVTLIKLPGTLNSAADPDGGSIVSGLTLAGQVNSASDMDGFQFAGIAGDRILVTALRLTGTCDTDLYLYPPSGGAAVASTHGAFGGGDRMEVRLASTGTYTILVSDWALSNSGAYLMTFVSMSAATTSIASGATTSGSVTMPSGLNAYQFSGNGGDRVILAAVSTSGTLDTDLYLYRPRGGAAIASSHGSFGGGDRLECQLDSTGTYTLVVSDWALANTGNFALTFLEMPGATGYSGDPDGGPIPMGASFAGEMQSASDLDAFQFYGGAGVRVLLTAVSDGGGLDTDMYLYPPGGGPAVAATHGSFGGGDLLEFQLTSTGVHTLVVADWSLSHSGPYHVTYLKTPGSVSWEGDRDGGLIKFEGIGFPAFPAASQGDIGVPGDLDAFEFYARVGDRVRIRATSTGGALDTDLFLYPPGGGPAEATSHGAFGGGDVLEKQLAAQGLYMIVLRDWSLQQTGTYTINLFDLSGNGLAPGLYGPQPPMGGRVYALGGNHFAWDPVDGATRYDLYYGTDVTTPLTLLTQTTANRADIPVLSPPDAVYYWRVLAVTPARTVLGPVWWFRSSSDPTDVGDAASNNAPAILFPNEPNPFNPATRLRFYLASPTRARLGIYDPTGRLVRTLRAETLGAGEHSAIWDGRDARGRKVASGVYIGRLTTDLGDAIARRLVLLK